jgi:hypothetical protein
MYQSIGPFVTYNGSCSGQADYLKVDDIEGAWARYPTPDPPEPCRQRQATPPGAVIRPVAAITLVTKWFMQVHDLQIPNVCG